MCTVQSILTKYIHADYKRVLTGLVCSVIVLDQKGVTVVPDLLASMRVVFGNQRLQLWIKDALSYDNINWRLTIPSWYREGSLPHGMHWRRWDEKKKEEEENVKKKNQKHKLVILKIIVFQSELKILDKGNSRKDYPKKPLNLLFMLHSAASCIFVKSIIFFKNIKNAS